MQKYIFLIASLLLILIKSIASIENTKPTLRNPFEKSMAGLSHTNGLQDYPVDTLQLIGTLIQTNNSVAVIRDPEEHCYVVTIGEVMGSELSKIIEIQSNSIQVSWSIGNQVFTQKLEVIKDPNNV